MVVDLQWGFSAISAEVCANALTLNSVSVTVNIV